MCTPPLSPGPVDAPLACLGRHGSSAPSSANADLAGAVGVRMGLGSAGESRFHLRKAFRMGSLDVDGGESDRCWAELVDLLEGGPRGRQVNPGGFNFG